MLVIAWPWIRTKLTPFFQNTPTSGGGKFGSTVMGVGVVTRAVDGGAGLIITLITESEIFAALSAFKPTVLVSKLTESGPAALRVRILAMTTSSEIPNCTMLMTS